MPVLNISIYTLQNQSLLKSTRKDLCFSTDYAFLSSKHKLIHELCFSSSFESIKHVIVVLLLLLNKNLRVFSQDQS